MPFRPDRLRDLRGAKNLSQEDLAERAGLSHSLIAKTENGKNTPRSEALDKLAEALDCTTDYLLGRGPDYKTPAVAAVHMAFDVFATQTGVTDEQREVCRRVLRHPEAPRTAQSWRVFAEMFELAQPSSMPLVLVEQHSKSKPMGVSRRHRN